ncbi:hypothetical protein [Halopelagius fulvigenes]|uniref:Uncharacterized protein n=1 Tax=Halopelagius fulvigenes TaxID=1198324 RepID=A0ABD5TZ70_9EURY
MTERDTLTKVRRFNELGLSTLTFWSVYVNAGLMLLFAALGDTFLVALAAPSLVISLLACEEELATADDYYERTKEVR